jgi:hypothetical protein
VPGLAERTAAVFGEDRSISAATNGTIEDDFAPLAVHIYVVPPVSWDKTAVPLAVDAVLKLLVLVLKVFVRLKVY